MCADETWVEETPVVEKLGDWAAQLVPGGVVALDPSAALAAGVTGSGRILVAGAGTGSPVALITPGVSPVSALALHAGKDLLVAGGPRRAGHGAFDRVRIPAVRNASDVGGSDSAHRRPRRHATGRRE